MTAQPPLTVTGLLAGASATLEAAGYTQADPGPMTDWSPGTARVWEDPYSIAALVLFETWADLSSHWLAAQDGLVQLISEHFSRGEAKAWEGYLILLTPSVLPSEAQVEATRIRRDTTHVRKLLGTSEDLLEPDGVERVLLPLVQLPTNYSVVEERSPFALLPEILGRRGIGKETVQAVVEAFEAQEPILERLHELEFGEAQARSE